MSGWFRERTSETGKSGRQEWLRASARLVGCHCFATLLAFVLWRGHDDVSRDDCYVRQAAEHVGMEMLV